MSKQRKQYSAAFKSKVALEAIKGVRSANEIATHYGVHPTQVGQWKKQALEHSEPPPFVSSVVDMSETARRKRDFQLFLARLSSYH